jgi:glucosamine--fructose-6-phosphate aminotransferase (isomerizing)
MKVSDFKMFSEISETPEVFSRLDSANEKFSAAVEMIRERKVSNVIVLARGTSDNAGHFLKFLIEVKLGLPVGLASPSSISVYGASLDFRDTLVIALSQSGQSPDLVSYAKAAKSGGALVISLTNDSASPLAVAGNFHIDLLAGPEIAVAATKSYSAELFASLKLVDFWKSGVSASYSKLIEATRKNIENLQQVDTFIRNLEKSHEIVVIGRGFSFCNAKELALKIQETSYIPVQGMSSADYQHGPIATLHQESQVFIMAPHGIPTKSIADTVKRIRENEPNIYWIGDGTLALDGELVLQGSDLGDEAHSTVADAVLLQYLTLSFAIKNGNNPDSPSGLSKVTLTL